MELLGTHFGTYEIHRDASGRPELRGFRHDPAPSNVGAAYLDLADHPLRVRQPMVRKGWLESEGALPNGEGRGREPFVAVEWDMAAKLVAREIERVRSVYSNEAIFGGSYGWASAGRFHHAQSQLKRFLNLCGGFVSSVNTYSYGAGAVLLPHVIGAGFKGASETAPTWDQIEKHSRLVIAFGGFRMSNAQVEAGGTGQHRSERWLANVAGKGVRLVVLSPSRADVPDLSKDSSVEFVRIRPNSDAAVILAMAHTLIVEGLTETAFVARFTVGFGPFADYLTGAVDGVPKSADWAAAISGAPADTIRELARAYAAEPALINLAWSLQRARFGEQPYWAAIALAAMAGQVGRPGCGFAFGLTAVSSVGQPIRRLNGPALDQGRNPIRTFIPVARITELLSRPGGTLQYDGANIVLPDIRLVYWAGGNPFHHHQDLNRLAEAWRRPETVIVHESMWTATARQADIVLPVAFPFEREDIAAASRDNWLIASRQVSSPPAGVLNDHQIFARIAREMGMEAEFTESKSEGEWIRVLYRGYRESHPELPDFETFWSVGFASLDAGVEAPAPATPLSDFVRDPDRHPLATPSGRIEISSETIANFKYEDCPGHPAWLEPEEWLGSRLAARFPFHLLSPQPKHRLHSQFEHAKPSQTNKINGYEPIGINPDDAKRYGISQGDLVEVFNHRGCCVAAAVLSPAVSPNVVVLATGSWYQPTEFDDGGSIDLGGNPNVLTSDRPTSTLSQATAPNSCLVDLRRARTQRDQKLAVVPPIVLQT